jgi:hypothetical protein
LIAFLGCTKDTPELTAKEDFDQTYEVYKQAETHQGKVEPWFAFIKRHPGSDEATQVVSYLASAHYLAEEEDPRGAVDFVLEYMAYADNDTVRDRYDDIYFDLVGESGIAEVLTPEEWESIRAYGEESLATLTPEKLREEAGEEELTDEEVAGRMREKKEHGYQRIAMALVYLGQTEAGLARFEEGSEFVSVTAAGFTYTEYPTNWAKTLTRTGDHKKAIEIAAPRAVILGDEGALSVLKEAYLAGGGSDDGFEGYVEETRHRIARTVPTFAAADYSGDMKQYGGLKGKVTLLTFWFPT